MLIPQVEKRSPLSHKVKKDRSPLRLTPSSSPFRAMLIQSNSEPHR